MGNVDLKAMIMSAGMGSRLEPLTLLVPKPLVTVANRPVMDILLENLSEIGINDVIANTYYLAEQIIDRYCRNSYGVNFNYIKEETLSGTAGGLKKCQFFFKENENFVVLSADGLTNADIERGVEVHKKSGAIATIGVKPVPHKEVCNFGVVVTDAEGFITEFQEKPPVEEAKSNCINTGIYIFNYKIFDYIPAGTFYDFAKDVFPKLLLDRQINTFIIKEYWSDIGTLAQYKASTMDLFEGRCKFRHGEIIKTARGAYISDSHLPDGTEFIGNSTIGKDCKIGKDVVLENCILGDEVKVADGVRIRDCVLASGFAVNEDICGKVCGLDKIVSIES